MIAESKYILKIECCYSSVDNDLINDYLTRDRISYTNLADILDVMMLEAFVRMRYDTPTFATPSLLADLV